MISLILVLAVVLGSLGAVFWCVARSEPNAAPALGTNNPYPDGVGLLGPGEDQPPYYRDAHRRPGAMVMAGVVDRSEPGFDTQAPEAVS